MLSPAAYFFNYYAIPNIAVSTLIFFTGLFVFVQNRRSPVNIFFFLFCLSLNFWLYGRAIMYCSRSAETALAWAKVFAKMGVFNISPLVYTFSVHWLGLYQKQKKYVAAAFVGAFLFYIITLITPYGLPSVRHYFWGYYPVYGPVCKLFLVFFFTYFLAAFRNFFTEWRKAREPVRRKQVRVVTIAFLISFTGAVDFLPKILNLPMYPFGYLSVCIWTVVMAYAIVRYRTMDIQTVIHKTLMWLGSMTVAMAPFAALVWYLHGWLSGLPPAALTLIFLILTVTFSFYLRGVQPYLDKVFKRRSADLNAVLTRFSAELAYLKNLRDILQRVVRTIRRNLYTNEISILLRDDSNQCLVPMISKGVRGLKSVSLEHPFLKWLETKDQVVLTHLVSADPEVQDFQAEIEEYIEASGVKVLVPFVLGGKLIGMAQLGNKDGMRRYTSEDVAFLSRLKSPVAIAFSNSMTMMAMQENLRKWNEELEKKVEERTSQLQDTQAQLIQAEKLATIGTLAGGVAHEINNPLTAVLANAQILKMTANPDDVESIDLIEQGAKRCQIIIQKLMKYARKPMGPEVVGKVDINKVVDNTVAFLKYQMEQENIKIDIEKKSEKVFVEGNANELEQVITNLILNAKDAIKLSGHPGNIRIQTAQGNGSANIFVKDNGIGISSENLKKIFDPFFTTKELGKGTGLGLAVSAGIIEKHRGSLKVFSKLEIGTEFIIELPISVK